MDLLRIVVIGRYSVSLSCDVGISTTEIVLPVESLKRDFVYSSDLFEQIEVLLPNVGVSMSVSFVEANEIILLCLIYFFFGFFAVACSRRLVLISMTASINLL